jgi:hypothetical protein
MVYTGCGNRNCGLADNSGSTPFWRAAYSVDVDAMRMLVSYGADANIPTVAPAQAVRRGGGGPPGAQGQGGRQPGNLVGRDVGAGGAVAPTPEEGQERFDAPPVPPGGPGAFPIHAAARGDNEMILYLVSKGADPKAVARSGQTTADMANSPVQRLSPIPETVALLMKLGSRNSNRCVVC